MTVTNVGPRRFFTRSFLMADPRATVLPRRTTRMFVMSNRFAGSSQVRVVFTDRTPPGSRTGDWPTDPTG